MPSFLKKFLRFRQEEPKRKKPSSTTIDPVSRGIETFIEQANRGFPDFIQSANRGFQPQPEIPQTLFEPDIDPGVGMKGPMDLFSQEPKGRSGYDPQEALWQAIKARNRGPETQYVTPNLQDSISPGVRGPMEPGPWSPSPRNPSALGRMGGLGRRDGMAGMPQMPGVRPAMGPMPTRGEQSWTDIIPQALAAAGDVFSARAGRQTGYLGNVMGMQERGREQTFRDQLQRAMMAQQEKQAAHEEDWRRYGAGVGEQRYAQTREDRARESSFSRAMQEAGLGLKARELGLQEQLTQQALAGQREGKAAFGPAMGGVFANQFGQAKTVEELDKMIPASNAMIAEAVASDPEKGKAMQAARDEAYNQLRTQLYLKERGEESVFTSAMLPWVKKGWKYGGWATPYTPAIWAAEKLFGSRK